MDLHQFLTLLITAVLNSLACTGIYVACLPGNILGFLPRTEITRMLYSCLPCMASVWGTAVYCIQHWGNLQYLEAPLYVLAVCGLNAIFSVIIEPLTPPGA